MAEPFSHVALAAQFNDWAASNGWVHTRDNYWCPLCFMVGVAHRNAGMLTPSADLPACRDEDPATAAVLAAAYPDPPEYQHAEEPQDADR